MLKNGIYDRNKWLVVIQFSVAEGSQLIEIYTKMKAAYGDY